MKLSELNDMELMFINDHKDEASVIDKLETLATNNRFYCWYDVKRETWYYMESSAGSKGDN